jgi:signal peptidase II
MVIVLDRLTKTLVVAQLGDGSTQSVIPGILDFTLVYNRGAAWGIFEGGRLFFLATAALAVLAVVIYIVVTKRHATLILLALGLLVGGAVGNAIDRALFGEVVDFVRLLFVRFPLFNVADSAITVGTVFLFIHILFSGRTSAEPTSEPVSDSVAEQHSAHNPEQHTEQDTAQDTEQDTEQIGERGAQQEGDSRLDAIPEQALERDSGHQDASENLAS